MMELDERLRPIAKQPVDITDPDWLEQFKGAPHPLDAAGVRAEAQDLLEALLEEYQTGEAATRAAIRELFRRYTSFAWAAALPDPPTTAANFRRRLLLFSMQDQGRDSRDAILELQGLCREAERAGLSPRPVLREIAALSSSEDKFGMGSTRELLIKAARED
jgi:hypothetical protein